MKSDPRTQVLPIRLADFSYPEGHPRAGQPGVVYAFAIRLPDGVLLVDSGLGPPHDDVDPYYRPRRVDLVAALRAVGVKWEDVRGIVSTHLHFDHCGGNPRFAGIPIFVQRAEYEASRRVGYTVRESVEFPGANYRLVTGDQEIFRGIRILSTPGHTVGHQSVVVANPEGSVVIAGHVIGTPAAYEHLEPTEESSEVALRSASKVRELGARTVFFSHCEEPWTRADPDRPA